MSRDLRQSLVDLLGPTREAVAPDVEVHEEVQEDGFRRLRISYAGPAGRVPAFLCLPDSGGEAAPLVYCHHQHNGQFPLGKSEVVGLEGDPDQAYAAELARRGFATLAPDAIGFEDRNWAGGENVTWFELSTRIVAGRTLLADCLQEITIGIDVAGTFDGVDASRVGFIGHSYGGRAAMWAPMWDPRIRASVSNAGCVSYRESLDRGVGLQAEFVVPGILGRFDVEDVLEAAAPRCVLVIARREDRWSRGANLLEETLRSRGADHVTVEILPGGHVFPRETRERAYRFLERALAADDHLDG